MISNKNKNPLLIQKRMMKCKMSYHNLLKALNSTASLSKVLIPKCWGKAKSQLKSNKQRKTQFFNSFLTIEKAFIKT